LVKSISYAAATLLLRGKRGQRVESNTLLASATLPNVALFSPRYGRFVMARYGKKASTKVKRAVHEMKEGKLRSGRSGKKVTSRKQAVAIGLSEARRAGGKVPKRPARKSAARKKK
jgi:hypothetical protein